MAEAIRVKIPQLKNQHVQLLIHFLVCVFTTHTQLTTWEWTVLRSLPISWKCPSLNRYDLMFVAMCTASAWIKFSVSGGRVNFSVCPFSDQKITQVINCNTLSVAQVRHLCVSVDCVSQRWGHVFVLQVTTKSGVLAYRARLVTCKTMTVPPLLYVQTIYFNNIYICTRKWSAYECNLYSDDQTGSPRHGWKVLWETFKYQP